MGDRPRGIRVPPARSRARTGSDLSQRSGPERLAGVAPLVAAAFFALGVLTRIPFQTDHLWAHDSVLYARGVERFDPLEQRPQAPGYLYYVLAIRALAAVTGDANRAMTLVSLVAGAAAVALLYVLAVRLYDERTGRIAGVFLLTAVTFWAYGGVAYPYTLLAALGTGCALLFWRATTAARGRGAALLVASVAWAVAVGFRSDLGVFLAPLWLIASWRAGLLPAAASAAAVAALVGVWYLASAAADGGADRFALALREQGAFVDETYSVFGARGARALIENAYELARYLGRALYFLAPLAVAVALSASARRIERADARRLVFVLAWTLTPLLVYVPIHVGEYGYVFSMLPGLAIVAARGAIALARGLRMPRTLPAIVALAALANASIFLLSDSPLSATDVIRRDEGTGEKVAFLERPEMRRATIYAAFDTVIVEHYLVTPRPGRYELRGLDPGAPSQEVRVAAPATVVVWDDLIRVSGPGWEVVTLAHGARLRIARVSADALLRTDGVLIELRER